MLKLLSITILAAISALTIPATANADASACSDGYAAVESVGGPLCVNPIYLDGTWNDHPSECLYGYYQGSCAPEPEQPVVFPVEAYTFQMDDPDPVYVAEVEAKRAVMLAWLSPVEIQLGDVRGFR